MLILKLLYSFTSLLQSSKKEHEPPVMKTLSYSSVKYTLKVPLIFLIVKKIERKIFDFVLFFNFFFSITHNSRSIQHMRTISTTNDFTTFRDLSFLVRAACDLRLTSFGPNHKLRWLSCPSFSA